MKKSLLWLCLLVMLWTAAFPVSASTLHLEQDCSLTLHYRQDGVGFPDLDIYIYRIGKYLDNGGYVLATPYDAYPVTIHNITSQKEWKDTAYTLQNYALSNNHAPTAFQATDADGKAVFQNLETGVYLVLGTDASTKTKHYRFEPFLIFAPSYDGGYIYDLTANPKPGETTPISNYTLRKLWKDSGNAAARPESITAEIFKDGVLWHTVQLNQENNWSYQWNTEEAEARWSVQEKDVPSGYTVNITQKNHAFTITNTKDNSPPTPPQTGDSSPLWLYGLLVGISGIGLLIIGILRKREYT